MFEMAHSVPIANLDLSVTPPKGYRVGLLASMPGRRVAHDSSLAERDLRAGDKLNVAILLRARFGMGGLPRFARGVMWHEVGTAIAVETGRLLAAFKTGS